jgi:four helix bundle protein
MDSDELKKRTKRFAHNVIKVVASLPKTSIGDHMGRQLIRCATSVAANYRAALHAQTKAAFIAKISIVVEEADESEFWLEFIEDERLLASEILTPVLREARELTSLFVKTRKTAQSRGQ